jgi:DNA repair protein REV1
MMLKIMRRAADAPLDPPKHLGHGSCDTFNRSVQLGVATNDAAILGRETISMLKSLRIPPGELRGIGLQMGKLERIGDAKMEVGQKKLQFAKSAMSEELPKIFEQAPPPVEEAPPPPPFQPMTPVKSTQFIAPIQIDPEVLANLPEDIRSRILYRKPVEIQNSQIDQDVFKELPASIQEELRLAYERPKVRVTPTKKKISPRKAKLALLPGQSKLPLAAAEELDASVLAELPSTIRQEVIDDNRREQALARAAKARHEAWLAQKAQRDRKVNRTITIPEPPARPTFQKLSELSDLRNLISNWFEELRDEGPAEEDVELLGNYLRKVVLIEKDLRKAEAVVRWFLLCCQNIGATMDEWYAAGQRLGDHVNEACVERGVGRINFDSDT